MDIVKKHLMDLSRLVHQSLRMLKMGETGSIPCSREFSADAIREYTIAYALHKKKWFKLTHDEATNVIHAERAPPPPWDKPEEEEEPDAV